MRAAPDYADRYDPDTDVDARFTRATARRIASWTSPGQRVLELGCATGLMTADLAAAGVAITAVDRSETYLARLRRRGLRDVEVVLGDVERVTPPGPWDHVVATSLLHEVADPEALLRRAAGQLAPDGLVHVTLQNPHSLHRIIALEMGLIASLEELSDRGREFGSTRLWTADELSALCARAGLAEVHREGIFLKPLANAQLAELGPDVLDGLERAARHLPDHCAMTYLVLRRG